MKEQIAVKHTINARTKRDFGPYYGPREIGETYTNIGGDILFVVTAEQAEAFERVVEHQGCDKLQTVWLDHFDKYLGLRFDHILIGIETDGYAHS